MLQISADRALFAERNGGHRLLACSGGVESWQGLSAIEMDLPDSAPAGVTWEPFFRGWPQGAFYFFSRTEPDQAARRPGMVRTQVARLRLDDASRVSDISQLFDYLSQSWSEEECAVALSISVELDENKLQAEFSSIAAMHVAERLSRGTTSQTPLIVFGERALRDLVIELWSRLPSKIRCSLVFGFSFSPADLKNRSLHLGCFPRALERRWHNYPNLLSDISSAPTISPSAAYLLRLPGGKAIADFVNESALPDPTLEQLAIFERVAYAWTNRESLDFEEWASLVLDLIVIAPQPEQAFEMKRVAVDQAVRRIRPGIADDILILRGFKMSALGDTTRPIKEGIFKWFRDCFFEHNLGAAKALATVLEKLKPAGSTEWKDSIREGLRGGFADGKEFSYPIIWGIWAASESVFEVVSPTDLTGQKSEDKWLAHLPQTLPSGLGEKLLRLCSGINWWRLHAGAALKFLPWESAIRRQLDADTGADLKPLHLICDAASSKELIDFTFKTTDQRVWDCTCERCVTHPEIFVDFDVAELGWVKLLAKTVTRKSDTLKKIKNALTILYSLLDLLIDGKLENEALLNAFANAGIANLSGYSRRSAIWLKLPPASCERFAPATAIGWLGSFLRNPAGYTRPEPILLQALFGSGLRGQRFISATPNLIESGLSFFGLFQDAPEEMFEEWLIAVAAGSIQLSHNQSNAVLQIVNSRKWENSLRTIQQIANERRRRDFENLWNAYWGTLSWQEKMLRRIDDLFVRNERTPPVYSGPIDYSMKPKSSEQITALFITALSHEFNAVRVHLQTVREKTVDGVVYAVGIFILDGIEHPVAVAQAGMGNVEAATLTERAIKHFSPRYAFFVGIAGGLKAELKLGDVVAAEKVYAYESGKAEKEFKTRPKALITGFASLQRAQATSRNGNWVKRITPVPMHTPFSYVKPIAAGEKVVDSHKSDAFLLIKKVYGDAYAVAMEEFGFYYALHANPSVIGAVVRGISDFSQHKGTVEKEKSQEQASANAAAFAYEMLAGFLTGDAGGSIEKLESHLL